MALVFEPSPYQMRMHRYHPAGGNSLMALVFEPSPYQMRMHRYHPAGGNSLACPRRRTPGCSIVPLRSLRYLSATMRST